MTAIFRDNKISAEGKILPLSDFKLFSDLEELTFKKEKMTDILSTAEKMLSEEIPFLPLSLYREFYLIGNRANFETPYFRRRTMALTLAAAEYFEKKGRFTDKLADVVWAIMEESSWIIPAHTTHSPSMPGTSVPEVYNRDRVHGIDLFSATTAATMATVYYLLKDQLAEISPIIPERMEYEINERAIKPFVSCIFWWSGAFGNKPNNWCPWICASTLHTAAVTVKDTQVRTRVAQRAMDWLDNFTKFYADDGGCDEGPGYWSHAGGSLFDCLEILEDMSAGAINVYDQPLVRAIGEYEAKMNIHGNRFVNFADCSGKVLADGDLLIRYGRKCGSDALIAFGADMTTRLKPHVNSSAPYRSVKDLMSDPISDIPASAALTKTYLSGLKVAVIRESSDTSRGMFFAMKGGHNAESHNHNDVGNFIVYYNGNPVLIDVGVGQYTKQTFSPQRYELWFMQSNYHNLPTFDGKGEMQGRQYESKNEVYDEAEGSLSLDITNAFTPDVGVSSYVRRGMLKDGAVQIYDSITLDKEREIDFHFMTNAKPQILSENSISLPEGRTLIFPASLTPEIEEFYSEGLDAKGAWGTENLWRIHLRTTKNAFEGSFVIK